MKTTGFPSSDEPGGTRPPLSSLEAALAYAAHGWPVLPVRGKIPLTEHGVLDATTDADVVRAWYARWPDASVGIATGGGSGLVVIDLDGPEGEAAAAEFGALSEPTLEVRTARGRHRYHPAPDFAVGNRSLAPHLDVRGDGGYVVAPPSVHESGAVYTWLGRASDMTPLPPRVLAAIRNGAPPARVTAAAGAPIPEGTRNVELASLAGAMRRAGFDALAIHAALHDTNSRRCRPPLDEREVRRIAESVARYEPADVPRTSPNAPPGPPGPDAREPDAPRWRSAAEVLADPEACRPPAVVAPRLAWRGRVSLLAAREKLGKSTLATAHAAAVSTDGMLFGEECLGGPVLWIGEEAPGDVARRLASFGANLAHVYLADPSLGFAGLADATTTLRPVLVVVDSLAEFVSGDIEDAHASAAWVPVLRQFALLARQHDAAVVLVHHARKSDGGYRDSTAIGAGVDVVLELTEGDEAEVRKVRARGRWTIGDYAVRLAGAAYELASGEISVDARVLLYVEGHPGCSLRELRRAVTARAADVDAALARLEARGAVLDAGEGRHAYRVPTVSQSPKTRVPPSRDFGTWDTGADTVRDTPPCPTETPTGHGWDTLRDTLHPTAPAHPWVGGRDTVSDTALPCDHTRQGGQPLEPWRNGAYTLCGICHPSPSTNA